MTRAITLSGDIDLPFINGLPQSYSQGVFFCLRAIPYLSLKPFHNKVTFDNIPPKGAVEGQKMTEARAKKRQSVLPAGFAGAGPNGSFFEAPEWVDQSKVRPK